MSGNAFGLNILAQTVRDRNALMAWLNAATPAATVVMDSHELTQQIKAALPNSTVISRTYNQNDSRWETATTPEAWFSSHVPFAANGVALQLYNEPAPGNIDAFLKFLEDVCRLCPPSVQLAFPNFAVGNPHENDIMAGKYDRLLRLVCGTRHILALHEYFKDDPVSEVPYLCGRYNYWMMRADQLMLPEPRIVITEHGRDVGGGRNDGWKGTGWSEQEYFDRLADANHSVYMPDVPVCIFCWGHGYNDDWLSFDIQDAGTLKSRLVEWNATHPIKEQTPVPPTPVQPPTSGGVPMRVTATAGLNLRNAPDTSAAILRLIPYNEQVTGYPDTATSNDGYRWITVTDAKGSTGWSADTYLKPETPPVPPETWTVNLAVPYVSQTSSTATKSNNDCGIASLLMQVHYWMKWHGLLVPSLPNVNMLVPYTRLGQTPPPKGLTFAELDTLAGQLGYKTQYVQPMTMDAIATFLREDKPVMVLVDYSVFYPAGNSRIAHLAIVKGYNSTAFLCADPYLAGDNYKLSRSQLENAMRSSPGNNVGFQGMVLAV